MANNYGLGRGLSSLIPQKQKKPSQVEDDHNFFGANSSKLIKDQGMVSDGGNNIQEVDINSVTPNPRQPRMRFDEEKLKDLSRSILEHGIIQPLLVSENGNRYEIIAGERRLEAAKLAGLNEVPVIIREASDQEKLELAIVENIQRHDLSPIEEAKAFKQLADDFDMNQEEISQKLGMSRSTVANKLRLLTLPVEIQRAVAEEKITEGHAKAILAIENPEKQRALFELILKNSLTVRQTEDKTKEVSVRTHKRNININPETKKIEDELSQKLGTKVKITKSGSGGKIVIEYYSQEELNNLINLIIK